MDLIIDNVIQQGASRYTVSGLTSALGNSTLLFLDGDISYARGEIAQVGVMITHLQAGRL